MISETRSVTHPGNYTRPIGRILVRQVLRSLKSTNQSGGGGVGGGSRNISSCTWHEGGHISLPNQ